MSLNWILRPQILR